MSLNPTSSSESREALVPATVTELARFLAANAQRERRPLLPVGGRTSLGFGVSPVDNSLEVTTSRLDAVVDYPARDMTVTVQAGCRVSQLQAQLATEKQRLPVDVPLSHRATIGGAVAADTAGPRRLGFGTLRDYVIGISCVTADGRSFKAGGRVVKNVAGYDLCKLMVGSAGTLSVVTEVTLKLKPLPESSALGWVCLDRGDVVEDILGDLVLSRARPVAIELLGPHAGRSVAAESRIVLPEGPLLLGVGLEGSRGEVEWQCDVISRELEAGGAGEVVWVTGDDARKQWGVLTDFQVGVDAPVTIRASLLPSKTVGWVTAAIDAGVSVQAHAGNGVVVGHLPDDAHGRESAMEVIAPLRDLAESSGGQVVVERCEASWPDARDLWGTPRADWDLMASVKGRFDPDGLLSPGRGIDAIGNREVA